MANANLNVSISTKGAAKASKELNSLSKGAKQTETNVIRAEKKFKTFGKNASAAVAAIDGPLGGISSRISSLTTLATAGGLAMTVLAVGVSAVSFALVSGVRELDKLNIGLAKSEALLKATGGASGFTAEALQDQAKSIALVTLASTEGIQKAQGILQTFDKVNGDVFTRAIVLGQDLAAVYGGDAASQATQLGKALQDPIKGVSALNRVGVTFSTTQKEQIRLFVEGGEVAKAQEIILANLASQVGGAGGAVAKNSLAGAFDTTGQLYSEWVANLANSTGTYTSVIGLVNLLNNGLRVSGELADTNSKRNFENLFAQKVALEEEIKAIQSGDNDSVFSFFGGSEQVELLAAQTALKDIEKQLTRIQQVNIDKAKADTAAALLGEKRQAEIRAKDLAAATALAEAKAAKEKAVEDIKLQRKKDAAEKELETILNLNNSELEAIQTLEDKRITAAAASYAQQLISFQEFQAAKTEIELSASTSRLELLQANENKRLTDEQKALETTKANINSVSDSLIDAAVSGDSMGEAVRGALIGISKQVIKSGIDMLVNELLVDKVASSAFLAAKTAEVTATTAQAGLNAFAATAAIPVVGPGLAPAAAAAASGFAASLGAPVIAAASAREQGGNLSAGQSSTVAERGQLEILTPSSSSRIRTKQQMKQLMGEDSSSAPSINIVNIDQSSGGVSIETSTDDDGRIIQLIRDTTALDSANPNSQFRKTMASATTLEARR